MARTILTVDDSPSVRGMVAMTLREAGYAVIEASDGREGLEKALAGKVDAILTDQNMPHMDGLSFIREYRKSPVSNGTPIIFLSTDSADDLKRQAREAGALGWMVKPFTQAQLLAVIKKVVGA